MKRKKFLVAVPVIAAIMAIPSGLLADEVAVEVVVTATRVATASEDVPNSVTIVTAEEIEASGARTVAEVLEFVPGLEFNALGGIGQQQSLFIRGADPEHVLVLIDGIEINDPASPKRAFNWAHLTVDNIERIEVVRGPAGPLYGSDAMAGVVNIITRRGEGETSVQLEVETGSFATSFGRVNIRGESGSAGYSLAISSFETDGNSAAEEDDGNKENDSHKNSSVSGRLDLALGESAGLKLIFTATDSTTDLDEVNGNTFLFGDDPNSTIDEKNTTFGAWLDLSLADGGWDQRLGVSVTDYHRDYLNPPDAANPNNDSEIDDGVNIHLAWLSSLDLGVGGLLTVGADYDRDTVKSEADFSGFPITVDERKATNVGLFVQEQVDLAQGLLLTAGARIDDHDGFDSQFTYRAGFAWGTPEDGSLVRGNLATGFKVPTIYQRFNSSSGNPDLEPETSTGWDVGLETSLGSATVGVTWFRNSFEDLIDFSGFTYFNVDEATTKGMEIYGSTDISEPFRLQVAYTALKTEDVTTGEDLIRRPESKLSLTAGYQFGQRAQINLTGIMVGERSDKDFSSFPAATVKLEKYALVNLAGSVRVAGSLELTGRVENLLDEEYQEAFGYGTPGVSAYFGVKAEL